MAVAVAIDWAVQQILARPGTYFAKVFLIGDKLTCLDLRLSHLQFADMKKAICALMLSLACQTSVAAAVPPEPDFKVSGLSVALVQKISVLSQAEQKKKGSFDQSSAQEIVALVMADKKIDAAELDLLNELSNPKRNVISFSISGNAGYPVYIFTPSEATQSVFFGALDGFDYVQAVNNGQDGFTALVKQYRKGNEVQNRVVTSLAAALAPAADAANMANRFAPLRDTVRIFYGYTYKPTEQTTDGRALLHASVKSLDTKRDDRLPDFLYNWIVAAPTPTPTQPQP